MDTAPRAALRRAELVTDNEVPPPAPEPARALSVMAVYELSEAGRKASLLTGGDGRALQQLKVQVPTSRLHLVSVDPQGTARLKLRPRFELDSEHRVVRTDAVPTYDAPPSLEDLFREAARNHELERVHQAERNAARAKRREAERARRDDIAKAFVADKSQRALVHPAPSPKRCTLAMPQGRVMFDIAADEGVARELPAEAHRRFRADLAAKKEKNLRERAAQLALHEEKKRFIAGWIEEHGTQDQKQREAAGVLPMAEAIEAITDQTFIALARFTRYKRNGAELLQDHIRTAGADPEAVVGPADLVVKTSESNVFSTYQWDLVKQIKELLPGSTVTVRRHVLAPRRVSLVYPVVLVVHSAVVTSKAGPLAVRREYNADSPHGVFAPLSREGR